MVGGVAIVPGLVAAAGVVATPLVAQVAVATLGVAVAAITLIDTPGVVGGGGAAGAGGKQCRSGDQLGGVVLADLFEKEKRTSLHKAQKRSMHGYNGGHVRELFVQTALSVQIKSLI